MVLLRLDENLIETHPVTIAVWHLDRQLGDFHRLVVEEQQLVSSYEDVGSQHFNNGPHMSAEEPALWNVFNQRNHIWKFDILFHHSPSCG